MNDCRKIRENLHDYAKGLTDSALSAEIERHLTECEECKKIFEAEKVYIENLPFVSQALSSLLDAQKLEDSVLSALKEKRAVPKKRFAAFGYGSAAALLLVAGILVLALRNPAIQDKAESLANGTTLAAQDSISDTSPLEDACDDSNSAVTPEADMGGNLPAMMKAPTNSESEKTAQSQSYDTLTTEADKSDEAFSEHLRISTYNTFLASNALHPVYPQILVGEENKELCYQNIIAENSVVTDFQLFDTCLFLLTHGDFVDISYAVAFY